VRIPLTGSSRAPVTVASGLLAPQWVEYTGGQLWVAEAGNGEIVGINPQSGAKVQVPGSFYDPDLAVSTGAAHTLFVAEDGLSAGSLYRYDVAATPRLVASNGFTPQDNIENLAISPDGTRVIPAAGAPYEFEEMSATTLQPDGLIYPANPYPSAVAVSASGLLATGLDSGYSTPDIAVYPLGTPIARFTETTNASPANVLPHGLALNAYGTSLFAVTQDNNTGEDDFTAFTLVGPPAAKISAPASGGTYKVGEVVTTHFTCAEARFGPGIASCTDSNGATGGTGSLKTSAAGHYTYEVIATSKDGERGAARISYTVG
jgi:hypothetical protein